MRHILANLLFYTLLCFSSFINAGELDECIPILKSSPYTIETIESYLSHQDYEEASQFHVATGGDYLRTMQLAAHKNRKALTIVFRSSRVYDGAGAEGFADAMLVLMTHLGDSFFAEVLKQQPSSVRQHVIDYIDFATPYDYSISYPRTFALGKHPPKCKA